MRSQPKLRPTAMHALHVPHHGTSRSSSGPSLQNQKRIKKVNDLLLDDTTFDYSAIARHHWRRQHLGTFGLIASSCSIEVQAVLESDAPVITVQARCESSGTSLTCNKTKTMI